MLHTIDVGALPGRARQAIVGDESDEPSRRTRATLENKADAFTANGEPLSKVLDNLFSKAGVSGRVQWAALEPKVSKDAVVTVSAKGLSWAKTLDAVLRSVKNLDAGEKPAWLIVDGTVVVSSDEDFHTAPYAGMHGYDISFAAWDHDATANQPNALVAEIIDLLKATVDTDSWRDNGGAVGSARVIGHVLIINQTAPNHRQIADILNELRSSVGLSVRCYDVRDIILGNSEAKVVSVGSATMPADRGGRVKQLIDTIQTTVARDSWRDKGGTTTSLAEFDGKFYITTTAAIHKQIETTLNLIRGKPDVADATPR